MRIALRRGALLLGLLMGGCATGQPASVPDRQVVYGYDGPCLVAASQTRAIYTTTGSLAQRLEAQCLAPPIQASGDYYPRSGSLTR
jgi:hypothetical protein